MLLPKKPSAKLTDNPTARAKINTLTEHTSTPSGVATKTGRSVPDTAYRACAQRKSRTFWRLYS